MKTGNRSRRSGSILRLVLVLALLALASGVPSHAIDQCHAPCLTAFTHCLQACGFPAPPNACSQRCTTNYNLCLADTVCSPTGQR